MHFYSGPPMDFLSGVDSLRMMVNSVFNGWRFEDVWLDE
jgi:hypothetical protein